MAKKDNKSLSYVILGIVAVIAIVGLVLLFKTAMSGDAVIKVGQKMYGSAGLAYKSPVLQCEDLIGNGQVPPGMDYETSMYMDVLNKFSPSNCVDARHLNGYWCCSTKNVDVVSGKGTAGGKVGAAIEGAPKNYY
ncbi:hypothetical protein GF358_01860 [Candidatus Woesearchaeota archaeon]|nr:hypothetical protein [Candidatus Woesearchaeota archaeon]